MVGRSSIHANRSPDPPKDPQTFSRVRRDFISPEASQNRQLADVPPPLWATLTP